MTPTALTPVDEPTALATTSAAPAVSPVKVGDVVRLIIATAGKVRAALGIVTGVGSAVLNAPVGENGEPLVTVVYLDSLNNRTLSSASWAAAFRRVGPVHHVTSPAVESGVAYTDILPMDASGAMSLDALELPDMTAAAAAEIQRKEANGVGRGPVPDKDIAFQTATATGIAEENAIDGFPAVPTSDKKTPVFAHTSVPEWPPKTAKIGVALTPDERNARLKAHLQQLAAKEDAQKKADAAPATTDRAKSILGGLAPASPSPEKPS